MSDCTHLDHVHLRELPEEVAGCEDCLASGGQWVHLRICLECGHVGCCDSSPNRHASRHGRAHGHPIIRSIEPGEDWAWCFEDELAMRLPQVTGAPRIPPSPLA
jgi:Zn-finger in ubiquitin-hydrolases and other protein